MIASFQQLGIGAGQVFQAFEKMKFSAALTLLRQRPALHHRGRYACHFRSCIRLAMGDGFAGRHHSLAPALR